MTIVYTYDEFMDFNNPDLSGWNYKITRTFFQISQCNGQNHISKEVKNNYPNKFNIYFNKKRWRKKIQSSDPEILKRIRSILGKVSPSTIDTMQDQIIDLLETHPHNWESVSTLFFENILDNVFVVDIYARLLIKLEHKFPILLHHIHHLSRKQVKEPTKYDVDTFRESAEDRTKRCVVANALYIIEMFYRGKYSRKYLNQTFKSWLDQASPENTFYLEVIVKVLQKIKKTNLDQEVLEKLTQFSNDKSYPGRLRFLLEFKE